MSVNAQLAELYGTPVPSQEETKQAQLEDSTSDFLGRAAAHAYVQEMGKIARGEVEVAAPSNQTQGTEGTDMTPEQQKQAAAAEFEAVAEKLAMDILHNSGYNPFTLEPYGNESEKTAAEAEWLHHVATQQAQVEKQASAPAPYADAQRIEAALYERAWQKLAEHGFEPDRG